MTKRRDLKPKTPVSDILPEIRSLIESSRYRVAATANLELVSLYWNIGRVVTSKIRTEGMQTGYASALIEAVAEQLTQYGRGFSISNLWDMKRFFDAFKILRTVSGVNDLEALRTPSGAPGHLKQISRTPSGKSDVRIEVDFTKHHYIGWSHYVQLMGENDPRRRRFYFDQTANLRWSIRELRRQIQSGLFERVALSKDGRKLIALEKRNAPHEVVRYENEPIGLILCTSKKQQHVELLLAHGPHIMQVSEYLTKLPAKKVLEERLRYYSQLLEEQS